MIKTVLADDHKIVLEGLAFMIENQNNIEVVGKALNGKEVLDVLSKNVVDVVVLDIEMPEMDGVETTRFIRQQYPDVKIVILTMYNTIGFIRKIAEAGAHGYILKNKGGEELVSAILAVYHGEEYFGEEVSKTLFSSMKQKNMAGEVRLTRREKDVLKLIADGLTSAQISEELSIAKTTVETHRRNLIDKTGVPNTKGLVRFAIEQGYS